MMSHHVAVGNAEQNVSLLPMLILWRSKGEAVVSPNTAELAPALSSRHS